MPTTIETYARWELTATIKGIKVSALSVTEAHKEKTLKHWKSMRAKDIVVVERDVPLLPRYKVEIPTRWYPVHFEVQASSIKQVQKHLEKLKYKKWQVMVAKIEKIEENLANIAG